MSVHYRKCVKDKTTTQLLTENLRYGLSVFFQYTQPHTSLETRLGLDHGHSLCCLYSLNMESSFHTLTLEDTVLTSSV